jgi:transposase
MQGHKPPPESSLFVYGDPYARLPRSAFYEALGKQLDLEWVREATRGLYADGVGRPSLDPVVFVKLMLVGYFENLTGDSELAFRVADSLTVRRFLGYGLGEATPERTTILKCRQRWPIEVFEEIFSRVLGQLASHGLVKGEHLGTDTVLIEANASMDSLRHREFGVRYQEFVRAFYSQEGEETSASEAARKDAHRPERDRMRSG